MAGNLFQMVAGVEDATAAVRRGIETQDWALVMDAARAILSAGSRLFQRAAAIADLVDEGLAVAEVDRALSRAPSEVPGQESIADELRRQAASAPKRVRAARGKGKA